MSVFLGFPLFAPNAYAEVPETSNVAAPVSCESMFSSSPRLFRGSGAVFGASWHLRKHARGMVLNQRRRSGRPDLPLPEIEARSPEILSANAVPYAQSRLFSQKSSLPRPSPALVQETLRRTMGSMSGSWYLQKMKLANTKSERASVDNVIAALNQNERTELTSHRIFSSHPFSAHVEFAPHALQTFAELAEFARLVKIEGSRSDLIWTTDGPTGLGLKGILTDLANQARHASNAPVVTPRDVLNQFGRVLQSFPGGKEHEARLAQYVAEYIVPEIANDLHRGVVYADVRARNAYQDVGTQFIALSKSPAALYVTHANGVPRVIDRKMLEKIRKHYADILGREASDALIGTQYEIFTGNGTRDSYLYDAVVRYLQIERGLNRDADAELEKLLAYSVSRPQKQDPDIEMKYQSFLSEMRRLGYTDRTLAEAIDLLRSSASAH